MTTIDQRIAQAIGWIDVQDNCYTPAGLLMCGTPPKGVTPMWNSGRSVVPRFSTDLAAAWSLLGWLKEQNRDWEYEVLSDDDRVYCVLSLTPDSVYDGEGPTAAAAITAAFLAAVCSEEA